MQPARHPETPETEQSQHSESTRMLSKMTNREQESGGTLSRGDSIRQHLLMPLMTVTNGTVKGWSPGVATRAGAVGLMVGSGGGVGAEL